MRLAFFKGLVMGGTFQQRGWKDRETNVRRGELLAILRKNREKHINDYESACAGYRVLALEKIDEEFKSLKKKVEELKDKTYLNMIACGFHLPVPVCHERAYSQAIRMMELEVDDVVQLTADQFACFVMDDWEWAQDWTASNVGYIKRAPQR